MEKKMTVEELERRLFQGEESEEDLLEKYPELLIELGEREAKRVEDYLADRLDLEQTSEEEKAKIKEWLNKKAGTK